MCFLKFVVFGSLVVLLSVCQSFFKFGFDDLLFIECFVSEYLKFGCQGEQCFLVNIDILKFFDELQLDLIVECVLLEMIWENNEMFLLVLLVVYEWQFLDSVELGWSSYL